MSGLQELRDDQAAVISLLVRERRSYADVARLLIVDERAVITRARAALDALAPRETTPPSRAERELLGDYLLGQAAGSSAASARRLLRESRRARVWARGVAARLGDLAPGSVPQVPAPDDAASPAPDSRSRSPQRGSLGPSERDPPSSRVGGAILLAALGVLVVVTIVLMNRSGGGGQGVVGGLPGGGSAAGATGASPFRVLARSGLTAGPAGGAAQGVAEIVSEGSQRAIAVAGRQLAPTAGLTRGGFDYSLWLSGPAGARELGVALPVGSDGTLQAIAALPARTGGFQTVLITRETTQRPTAPGPVVLSGGVPRA